MRLPVDPRDIDRGDGIVSIMTTSCYTPTLSFVAKNNFISTKVSILGDYLLHHVEEWRRLWTNSSPEELEEHYGIYLHDHHVFIEPRLYFYDEQSDCFKHIDSLPRRPLKYRVSQAEYCR